MMLHRFSTLALQFAEALKYPNSARDVPPRAVENRIEFARWM